MSQPQDHICPWCQTEIVWDPEIGPEESCPHCLNDLGPYRSVQLTVKQNGHAIQFDDDEEYDELDELDLEDVMELEAMDEYEEGVQRILDHQDTAPECSSCQSFMLFAGVQSMPAGFLPYVQPALKKTLVQPSFATQVYICPSCFKVEQVLEEKDRIAMTEQIKKLGKA
ncbi:hypothetical protein [Paenibacillus sp. YYML68]|uniref:hypothetical protein n=1 Tax=Paenibacillus sp. YYML68 TaxID=2909250 RepID=UPI002493B017|nr:hypothetical protein [Paenibacillus sp. YYML68]